MISVKDLRIGNWVDVRNSQRVIFGKEPRYTEVYDIGFNGINISSSFEGSFECDYKEESLFGIELNPSILEKFGFENLYIEYCESYRNDKFHIEFIPDNSIYIRKVVSEESSHYLADIKYIHELQNIHYDLFKTELTITL